MYISNYEYILLFRYDFQTAIDKSKVNLTKWFSRYDPGVTTQCFKSMGFSIGRSSKVQPGAMQYPQRIRYVAKAKTPN